MRRVSSSPASRWRSAFTPASSTSASRARPISPGSARRSLALYLGFLPGYSLAFVAILAAALFGAAFAAIPGYLQAKRDSHIVITTIMFNYIASALMGYLLVNVLRVPGQMNAGNRAFPARRHRAAVP